MKKKGKWYKEEVRNIKKKFRRRKKIKKKTKKIMKYKESEKKAHIEGEKKNER